ncbi:MAG: malate synthase A [Candidatus Dormiibacterota bacterium]
MSSAPPPGTVQVLGDAGPAQEEVLTEGALRFVAQLERRLRPGRAAILEDRRQRQLRLDQGEVPDFLAATRALRDDRGWRVAAPPADLVDRRVEITGPVDAKMLINALNSGARTYMADFEDANSPTWPNCVVGQANLRAAVRRELEFEGGGRIYRLGKTVATLLVRPRGWHLPEKHMLVDGQAVSASLFDFALFVYHNARELLAAGSGPYLYLPKLEGHLEARLWEEACRLAEEELQIPSGSIRVTVLIENILAAFEMEEILFELRDRATGLNAGRWDYLFSVIRKFREDPAYVLPDRSLVTMAVPFMRSYAELLVRVCHGRGTHAMGGMAAFVPNRRDPEVTARALQAVALDKEREASQGFDGTWVAHPDLVPVATQAFDRVLGARPNQLGRLREDVEVGRDQLLAVALTEGTVSPQGLRTNCSVGIRYLGSWLQGSGAVAIDNLMEDAATAEISRSQIWQWLRHGRISREELEATEAEVMGGLGEEFQVARQLFHQVAAGDDFVEFLTLPAYQLLE